LHVLVLFSYSIVSIVTHCGLGGPGIELQWGQDFLHPSRLALGLTHLPIWWVLGSSWE